MKFLITSDWHADWSTAGVRRFDDVKNAAFATVRAAENESVDFYLFLGDLTDPDVGAFWANNLAISIKQSLPNTCRSFWLVGNHDAVEDGYGTHAMLPLAAYATVIDEPKAICLRTGDPTSASKARNVDTWLLCFPYVSTARGYDPTVKAAEFCEQVPKGSTVVIASHLMLEGIGPGSETQDMPRGRDVFLPVKLLRSLFPDCTIFSGHYHTSQVFDGVHIPGSLVRLTKGEIGNVPGYLIAEVP